MQNDVYLSFIDYANAVDKVRQKDLTDLLSNLDIFRKKCQNNQGPMLAANSVHGYRERVQ